MEGEDAMSPDETRHSRFVTKLAISLAVVAVLVILGAIAAGVMIHIATKEYESLHDAVERGDLFAVQCFLWRR